MGDMKIVGAIGYPIEHSLSPAMHNAAFAALGMADWRYDKFAIPPDILGHSLQTLRSHGVIGINVTVPHKEAVLQHVLADSLAQRVGAANTVDLRTRKATNTDVGGFMDDLAAHGIPVHGERVVILGAGGAARAVIYGLTEVGAHVAIVNRTPERAYELLRALHVNGEVLTLEAAGAWGASLIVNCTPVGMYPHEHASPWDATTPFPHDVTVYDTIYRPAKTRLLELAEAHGGRAINGMGMLVRQGAAAFRLWTGVEPPLDVMFTALKQALGIEEGS
ncbi:MAG: shikimate dehydrogenase [bacterium]|nr:shikimate dehydrogenase [bacterium]